MILRREFPFLRPGLSDRRQGVQALVELARDGVQALVEFADAAAALQAKTALTGQDIYAGCCTLKVDYYTFLPRAGVYNFSWICTSVGAKAPPIERISYFFWEDA